MNKLWLSIGLCIAGSQAGWGATMCGSGTLATYIALGTGGCTIGGDTFSMFGTLAGQTGAMAINPGNVAITPSGTSAAPMLTFDLNVNTAATLEAIFTYRIFGASFTGSSINVSNAMSTGDGSITDIQNLCGAGTFGADGVSGCSGTTLGPLVVIAPGGDQTPSFAGVSFLTVTDDLTVDGGLGGTASAGRFVDKFTATVVSTVPEPGTILITGFGAALFITSKLRSRRIRKNA